MADQLYGYNTTSYGGETNLSSIYPSRSISDQYISADSSFLSSSRYISSDPLASSSISNLYGYSYISDRDTIGSSYSAAARIASGGGVWPGPPGVDMGKTATSVDPLFTGLKRPSSEALYHQTLLGTHNTLGQSEAWYSTNPLVKRPRFESTSNLPIYPQRPGEKDCAHYMLTRTCKFGDSCKFDHPIWVPEGGIPDWKEVPLNVSESLPERPGEPDCPYFLKTQRCKFGLRCKFNHPKEKMVPLAAVENAEVSALPERPTEPLCAFYMKTGNCKFGPTCKFHHPKDIAIPSAGLGSGSGGQAEAVVGGKEDLTPSRTAFAPALLHNSKGLPIRPEEVDCPFYLKTGSCKYGATCRYNHPDRLVINPHGAVAATPAHMNFGTVDPAASILQTLDPRLTQTTLVLGPAIYPQRPGHMECDFYMKTGDCKYGERCKFHHPIDRSAHTLSTKEASQQSVKLTLAGLPRREGSINCPYYMKTGACKYGATCKFDHPPPAEVMAVLTSKGASTTAGVVGNDGQKENEAVEE